MTEAGLSKLRAKFQFEQVDTEVHLAAPRLHRQLTRAGAAASHKQPPHPGSSCLSSGQTTDCLTFGGSSICSQTRNLCFHFPPDGCYKYWLADSSELCGVGGVRLEAWLETVEQVLASLNLLGANSAYEKMIVSRCSHIRLVCRNILQL